MGLTVILKKNMKNKGPDLGSMEVLTGGWGILRNCL